MSARRLACSSSRWTSSAGSSISQTLTAPGDRVEASMQPIAITLVMVGAALSVATPAFAQRSRFERTFQVDGPVRLDVVTERGKVDISPGRPGSVVIEGVVT